MSEDWDGRPGAKSGGLDHGGDIQGGDMPDGDAQGGSVSDGGIQGGGKPRPYITRSCQAGASCIGREILGPSWL